ncbi:MAG: tRNA dihydrouridine synthase DusB [Ruminococcus sp.]|nr:tRNA dihydrouridine synthase DusB [Ruminococcus sp.]
MEYIKIGNVKIEKTAALAPMASVADRAYRMICREYGSAYVVSEMVSAKGLCYSDRKTNELCTVTEKERPMAVQIFGSEPEFMEKAVEIVSRYNPDIIDINMGCPVPKVVGIGCGCSLMRDIKLAYEVAKATVKAAKVPVTVKFRKGWDDNCVNAVEFAKAMESAGVAAIAVHGRTREQFYTGKADWKIISEVKKSVTIPVIGNGDVTDLKSCLEMYEQTGCDLVMIGRGSYGNPFVFKEIASYFNGKEYTPPDLEERMSTMLRHIRLIIEISEKPTEMAIREARKHAAWYMNGFYGSAKFRARCYNLSSYAEAESLAEEFINLQKNR